MSPLVIAHRGASGYLPEHTLEAKALAHGMGADFLEQDVVLTRDDQPIVLHDLHLETTTDVASVFPGRAREDGRYYAIDFTLEEVRRLRTHERSDPGTGNAVHRTRFPLEKSCFGVSTLGEEIELVQGLNHSTGRDVGIYTEIKSPVWHREQGKDITPIVLAELERYGYRERGDNAWVQCFDASELQRMRRELGCRLKLVLLIGGSDPAEVPVDRDALREVATYADGIGPQLRYLVEESGGEWNATALVEDAHASGLVVHPYTLRVEELPAFVSGFDELLHICFEELGVDGAFTDHPDRVVEFLGR